MKIIIKKSEEDFVEVELTQETDNKVAINFKDNKENEELIYIDGIQKEIRIYNRMLNDKFGFIYSTHQLCR